jgi:hypothetical protein
MTCQLLAFLFSNVLEPDTIIDGAGATVLPHLLHYSGESVSTFTGDCMPKLA